MENRSSNENWEIFTATKISLSIVFDIVEAVVFVCGEKRNDPARFVAEELTLSKETKALAVVVADLANKRKSVKAAEKRFFKQLDPLLRAWGHDLASALMTGGGSDARNHECFRYVVKDCPLDVLMSEMIAGDAELSAERDRRALSAAIPARPAPARRIGWL